MNKKTISILGCGWLGLPLALKLKQSGYAVKGSTSTPDKLAILKEQGLLAYHIECSPDINPDYSKDFFDSQTLFLNIPFKRGLSDPSVYQKQIDAVIKEVEASMIDFVIFASSTSIYPEKKGVSIEDHPLVPDNNRSKVLLEIEESLIQNEYFSTTILRFAGLYGGDRQIGRFLSGKIDVDNGDSPVNLVHLDDCVEIITQIIRDNIRKEIFNVCSDHHPTRRELYTQAAVSQNFAPPVFNENKPTKFKVVSNEKLKKRLNYQFIHPDPMSI